MSGGWGIKDAMALIAELDKELATIEADAADRIAKGRLTQQEADYVSGLVKDIREDLTYHFGPIERGELAPPAKTNCAVAWGDKLRWINAELAERQRDYPEAVRKGRMTEGQARRGLAFVAALRRMYWNHLFCWSPPAGPAANYLEDLHAIAENGWADKDRLEALRASPGARELQDLVRGHMDRVELEEQGQRSLVA